MCSREVIKCEAEFLSTSTLLNDITYEGLVFIKYRMLPLNNAHIIIIWWYKCKKRHTEIFIGHNKHYQVLGLFVVLYTSKGKNIIKSKYKKNIEKRPSIWKNCFAFGNIPTLKFLQYCWIMQVYYSCILDVSLIPKIK